MVSTSHYDRQKADYAVSFIECLKHTKGSFYNKPFKLLDWQERIIRDLFGIIKPNGYRQFNTAYIECPKKQGKTELAAAVALLMTCGDGVQRRRRPPAGQYHLHGGGRYGKAVPCTGCTV